MFGFLPWWVKLDWRLRRRWFLSVCAFELPVTVAILTLFGIADPNTYRTKLWQEGADHGWNSSPIELLYAAANYEPIPAPRPWNQFVTDWNVIIAVLSTFILIVKVVMFLTHTLPPMFSAALHLGLVIVWCYSAALQTASDYSDPEHPSRMPWYLTRGCGDPVSQANKGYCQQAVGAFGVTIIEIVLYFGFFVLSVVMSIPSAKQKEEQSEIEQEAREWAEIENFDDKQFNYELDQMHMSMHTPASAWFPSGVGVLQQQQQQEGEQVRDQDQDRKQDHEPQKQLPPTPGKDGAFVHEHEIGSALGEPQSQAQTKPNKDLPLRHHFSSDVYS